MFNHDVDWWHQLDYTEIYIAYIYFNKMCDNLCLSAVKTVINPKSTTILGWIWNCGTLKASPHRIAALASETD